jgi:hypothetical protein
MPHKSRHQKFIDFWVGHQVGTRLKGVNNVTVGTGNGSTTFKQKVPRFKQLPDCINFFDPDDESLWLPEITDTDSDAAESTESEYIHNLNESALIPKIREHALDCRRCQLSLDAFWLSQTSPNLYKGMIADILNLKIEYDPKKHLFIAGLPSPQHPDSTKYGRLILVTPLTRKYGKSEFKNTMVPILNARRMSPESLVFNLQKKHDGSRKPCYQATTRLPDGSGYICIRSRAISSEEDGGEGKEEAK